MSRNVVMEKLKRIITLFKIKSKKFIDNFIRDNSDIENGIDRTIRFLYTNCITIHDYLDNHLVSSNRLLLVTFVRLSLWMIMVRYLISCLSDNKLVRIWL